MNEVVLVMPFIAAYLLGALPFGLMVARLHGVKDIRQYGSGNIGATNVVRVAGFRAAMWVYVLDIGKGMAAILLARQFDPGPMPQELYLVAVALTAVLGHVFPVYLHFKGGKGVNTLLGTIVILLPWEALACVMAFAITVGVSRYISLGSILGALTLPVVILVEQLVLHREVAQIYFYAAIIIAILVLLTHRQNIRRLLNGTENRFSFSTGTGKAGSHG